MSEVYTPSENLNELDPKKVYVDASLRTRSAPPSAVDVDKRKRDIAEVGQLQPIGICPMNDPSLPEYDYKLIYGEHRLLACVELGIPIRADVFDVEHDADILTIQFMENDGRKELSLVDKLHTAMLLRDKKGLKQSAIGTMMHMSTSNVSELLKLEKLPDAATALMKSGKLNKDQALALLDVNATKREKICEMIKTGERSWTAEQLREYSEAHPVEVKPGKKPSKKPKKKPGRSRKMPAVLEAIDNTLKMGSVVCDVAIPLGDVLDRLKDYIAGAPELNMTDLFGDLAAKHAASKPKKKAA